MKKELQVVRSLSGSAEGVVWVAKSADTRRVISTSWEKSVLVWDVEMGSL